MPASLQPLLVLLHLQHWVTLLWSKPLKKLFVNCYHSALVTFQYCCVKNPVVCYRETGPRCPVDNSKVLSGQVSVCVLCDVDNGHL